MRATLALHKLPGKVCVFVKQPGKVCVCVCVRACTRNLEKRVCVRVCACTSNLEECVCVCVCVRACTRNLEKRVCVRVCACTSNLEKCFSFIMPTDLPPHMTSTSQSTLPTATPLPLARCSLLRKFTIESP